MKKNIFMILPIASMLFTACEKKEDTKKIERCIDQICEKVVYDCDDGKLYIKSKTLVEIPAEEAIKISKNWDLNNIKLYTNSDKKLQEHEKDACETLYNLNIYISSHDLDVMH